MAIQPQGIFAHYDAIEKSRSRLAGTAFIPNRSGDAETLNIATPVAIGAGGQYVTPVIMVAGFTVFTLIFMAAGAFPCRLIYIVIDPVDGTTQLTEVVVGDNANDAALRPFSWSNAAAGVATAPAVHYLIKLKFTGVGGATTINQVRGLWMAAS